MREAQVLVGKLTLYEDIAFTSDWMEEEGFHAIYDEFHAIYDIHAAIAQWEEFNP